MADRDLGSFRERATKLALDRQGLLMEAVIEVLKTENRVLREQFGGKRLRLTDDQRRRLAANGKALGRKLLAEVATIVTPDTILVWYWKLIAKKA